MGGIRLHTKNSIQLFICENRSCQYNHIDDAYSWEHVNDLGWAVKPAEIWDGKKASKINPDLMTDDGNRVELYCCLCKNN